MAISSITHLVTWLIFTTVWALAYSQSRHRALNRSFVVLAACCALFSICALAIDLPIFVKHLIPLVKLGGFFELVLGILLARFAYRFIQRKSDVWLWISYGLTGMGLLAYLFVPPVADTLVLVYLGRSSADDNLRFAALFATTLIPACVGSFAFVRHWHLHRSDEHFRAPRIFIWSFCLLLLVITFSEVIYPLVARGRVPFDLGFVSLSVMLVLAFVELRRHNLFEVDSDRVLAHLLQDIDAGVALVDSRGAIRQMNPWMRELVGRDTDDGRPLLLSNALPWAADLGGDGDVEFQLVKDGEPGFFLLSRASYQRRGKLAGQVCFVQDISEAKRTEEISRMSREELEREVDRRSEEFFQMQKMAAVGALAPGIVHDFNNMLATIIGLGSAAMSELPAGNPITEDVDEILQAAYRARDLVRQLPTENVPQSVERTVVKLGRIVDDVIGQVVVSLGRNIEIRHETLSESSFVLGNPTQLHQVALNLVNNAAQEMKHTGGELGVFLDSIELEGSSVNGGERLEAGDYVRLRVSDTGRGMDDETLSRVFEPFFTTKQTGEGTGLGLALVRKVVQEHAGVVSVESRPGEGSAFTVLMPSIVRDRWSTISPERVVEGGDEQLLIVDDDESVGHATERMLETLGYRTVVVGDPFEALLLFKSDPQRFDAVLTDYSMPGMNGLNLAAAMFEVRPEVPIILTTGVSDNLDLQRLAADLGVREMLVKPVTKETMAGAVRQVVSR